MADKEATVYIIDLGSTMGDCHNGRTESDLDWAMRYVWDKLSTTVAASRKTWQVGVVGLRTDETDNVHHEDQEDGYENIAVLQELAPMTMTSLKDLRGKIKPSETEGGDAVSAIIVAADMIDKVAPQRLKFNRKIMLVTDGQGAIDSDDLDDISARINELNIELTVVGVDFDDSDYPFKEEDKPKNKARNEKLLKGLADACKNSVFGTVAQAVEELDTPRIKSTRPYKSFDGQLTLGNPEKYKESALSIRVERYFKTKLARPVAATTVTLKSEPGVEGTQLTHTLDGRSENGAAGSGPGGDSKFASVAQARTYKINDPSAPGGKRDVEYEDLAKGYEYGRTAVHISESEHNITKLETTKDFSILGFIPNNKYEPFLNMGEVNAIVPSKFSEKDEVALSALIHALYETESYAVARLVAKDDKDPQLLLLMPWIEPDFECLYDVPLPFAEDVRAYQFPPLDKVVTVGGAMLTKHRLLPSKELEEAMSDYVDAMDISAYNGIDDDDTPLEYAPIEDTFSPMIHRVNQAIRFRAVHPDEPIEPMAGVLTRYSVPPKDTVEKAVDQIDQLVRTAEVKKVPPKAKGKRQREVVKPISGLDVDALLSKNKRTKISKDNSIPEFKQALATATEVSAIESAAKQMGEIVWSLIGSSTADLNYDRAAENMHVMREGLIELEEPGLYNDFVRGLKRKIASGELNGDRREMWWRIKFEKLGLVTKNESEASGVNEEEAGEFLRSK